MPVQQTPIITKRHTDSNGNYTLNCIEGEVKQVIKRHILLEEIPHPHLGITVSILDSNTVLKEVDYTETLSDESEFKIDYSQGKIWFHSKLEAKKVSIDYWGLGYDMIHASRIYTQLDINGDVCETLGDILDYAVVIIDELGEVKEAVVRGEKLLEDLLISCNNALALLDSLGISIKEGSELDKILKQTILEATDKKDTLDTLLLYAQDKIDELNSLSADIGDMIDISNNYYLLEVKQDLQSKIDDLNDTLNQLQQEGATHNHDNIYLKLDGSNKLSGGLDLASDKTLDNNEYGLDANNSDIVNVNKINFGEGKNIEFVDGKLLVNNKEIWTSDNQGQGSGLDADTLDGKEAKDFIQLILSNGMFGMGVNNSDIEAIRTTQQGLLPYDANMSTLGNSAYPFLSAYVSKINGCHTLHMDKNGGVSKIEFDSPNESNCVYFEHKQHDDVSTYRISMGKDCETQDSFQVGYHQEELGFTPVMSVSSDGTTNVKEFSLDGRKIYIQTTQPTDAPEGSLWFVF